MKSETNGGKNNQNYGTKTGDHIIAAGYKLRCFEGGGEYQPKCPGTVIWGFFSGFYCYYYVSSKEFIFIYLCSNNYY